MEGADAARAALQALLREDPELPADIWFGTDEEELVAGAAANALDATEMDVAARLLDVSRLDAGTTGEPQDALVSARTALDALRENDPELALATLLIAPFGTTDGILIKRLAEKTAEALDRGSREQRMLGVLAMGIDGDESESASETRRERCIEWAAFRNLPNDRPSLEYLAVSTCLRRRGSKSSLIFEACAARCGQSLFAVAPALFEEAAQCARRCLDAGAWSWSSFATFAQASVLHGHEAELAERMAAIVARHPSRAKLLSRTVEQARDQMASELAGSQSQLLRLPTHGVDEAIGTFAVDSGLLTVGDPGYINACLRFHVPLVGAKTGTWRATVLRAHVPGRGERCAALIAHHASYPCSLDNPIWRPVGSLDVEYAIAGIFDSAHYYEGVVDASVIDEARVDENPWYAACARRAHGRGAYDDRGAGVLPFGCVSSTGFGDGGYTCYAFRAADGEVVGVCIDFDLERTPGT